MTSQMDNPSSQFEIERLLELLNAHPQGPGQQFVEIHDGPVQSLVEAVAAEAGSGGLNVIGVENRFVAHISQAMSKTGLGSFDISW